MHSPDPSGSARLGLVDGLVLLSELVQTVFAQTAAAHDLPPLQARLLGILRGRRPNMVELGHLLGLDKSSTTGLIDRATRRALVRRVTDPRDGRSYRLELTGEGRRIASAFVTDITGRLSDLTASFTGEERDQLAALVSDLVTRNADSNGIDLSAELDCSVRSSGPSR